MLPGRRELAKEYGVSTITVGRAIDGLVRDGLLRSDDRRGTFVASAPEAPGQRGPAGKTLEIAVVATLFLPQQDKGYGHNPWTRQVVSSLEQELANDEHHTLFVNTVQPDGSGISLDSAVEQALAANPDGIIVVAFSNRVDEIDASQRRLLSAGIPCVMISSTEVNRPIPHVFPDGFDAGYQAGQHLIRHGCREVAYISPFRAWWAEQRGLGLRAAFEQAGFGVDAVQAFPAEATTEWNITTETREPGYEAALSGFQSSRNYRGFVGATDDVASSVLSAGTSLGRVAGRDFLVVGFDDIPEARHLNLTSLRIPWDSIGVEAARLLRQSLRRQGECLQVRVRWRLIPRGSTRWQKGAAVAASSQDR